MDGGLTERYVKKPSLMKLSAEDRTAGGTTMNNLFLLSLFR